MFIANFVGLMAVPTDPPYCLVYPNIYSTTVPHKDRHHFNDQGGPPGLHTCACICHTLLQHANLSEAHRWKYHGSHLVIPRGARYSCLLPKITMLCNHRAPLVDLHMGEPFPLVLVGDFQFEDNIFPGMPGDSLLYNSDDLTKLCRMRFQVTTHWTEHPKLNPRRRSLNLPAAQVRCPARPARMENLPNPEGSLLRPPHQNNHRLSKLEVLAPQQTFPLLKECHESHNKDSNGSKHWDKSRSESSKSSQKHAVSPLQKPSSTTWVEKEPCLEGPPLVFRASSQSHQPSKSDDQFTFTFPTSASTPNKMESGPQGRSVSSNSRRSMTPFEMGLGGSFNIPGGTGMCHGSLTPATSVTGLQQVTSNGWHQPVLFSPLTLQGLDPLSAKQATKIYQLATECQALGSDLARWFQTICRLKATHHTTAHATAYETVLSRCLVCSTAYAVAATTQQAEEWESTLHRLPEEANKVWKDANDIIFSHLLKYDSELANFFNSAEDNVRNKRDEIWRHVHSLAEAANCSPHAGLSLALQTLNWLPSIPWNLSYCMVIPMMFAYSPELYELQSWGAARDGEFLLDNHAWAANLLSHKRHMCMAEQALTNPAPAE